MVHSLAVMITLVVLLTGCAGSGAYYAPASSLVGAGTLVRLNQDLEIPAERTRVFFQRGKVLPDGGFDQYYPSCDLEVRTLSPEPQRVVKDRFMVTRIEYGQEAVARLEDVRVAAIGIGVGSALWWDRGESIFRYLRIWLYSERQPDVMRLTCRGAWEDYFRANPPNDVEIRIALGHIMTFEGAPGPGAGEPQ